MVYKKYIKRDGKFYGPYLYNSRRVDGKVISEYQGIDKKDNKKFIFLIIGGLILLFSIFMIINQQGKISGKVVSNLEGGSITDNVQEEIRVYPKIYFTLISTKKIKEQIIEEKPNVTESEQPNSEIEKIPSTNESTSEPDNSAIGQEIIIPENFSEEIDLNVNLTNITEKIQINKSETKEENTSIESGLIEDKKINESKSDENEVFESNLSENSNINTTLVTEGVISQVLNSISNFFLGFLNPTGMSVSESSSKKISIKINGETSSEEFFSYKMEEGEIIELDSGSVKTASKNLADNILTLSFEGNMVIVKTNYSEPIESNSTLEEPEIIEQINFNTIELNEEEEKILSTEFGNFSVETAKFELFNGRYIVRYELRDYNIEYSYDSDLGNETLKQQMERDKFKWLKDIAFKLDNSQ